MQIDLKSSFPRLPETVVQLRAAGLIGTAVICWLVIRFSWLADRRQNRRLGSEMYVMF